MIKPPRGTLLNHSHPLNRGLVGCWLHNEMSGTSSFDLSGNQNHGILTNGPVWSPSKFGGSLDFDGSDDYIQTPIDTVLTSATFTAWVRFKSFVNWSGIISSRGTDTTQMIIDNSSAELRYNWNDGTFGFSTGLSLTLNKWLFCAVSVNPNSATVYLGEGGSLSSSTNTTSHSATIFDNAEIGRDSATGARNLDGILDETRIYNRALSASEIKQLFKRPPELYESSNEGFKFRIISTTPISTTGEFIMISPKRMTLLDSVTSNVSGPARFWAGVGKGSLHVFGTWDTATVTIQGSLDGGVTWTAISGLALTDDSFVTFEMGLAHVRAVSSSVGASTSLSAYVVPQEQT